MDFPKFDRRPIDLHSHFNHGAKYEEESPVSRGGLDFLTSEAERLGIKEIAFSTYSSVLGYDTIIEENSYLHELSLERENIYQWVVVHPDIEESFKQAREFLGDKKALGIKIHPGLHKYSVPEKGDVIFSFADSIGATVLTHPTRNLKDFVDLADKYPNMKLIIAHIDSVSHVDSIKNAKHGNIYTDTSGCLCALNSVIEYAVEQVGSEKIFFGTDTYSPASHLSRIAFANIADSDKENILYKNALRCFEGKFE
jgi:predicted TIM-barrel fold metal-dependent hydrolase